MKFHAAGSYLLLPLLFSGLFASMAFSQESGKTQEGAQASPAAAVSKTITGKARLLRAGAQSDASKGTASDVSVIFYLSDDKRSIVKLSVSIGKIDYKFRVEAEGATSSGTKTGVLSTVELHTPITKGNFEWGEGTDYHFKGQLSLPAQAKGTLHLFHTYRRASDYQQFRFDLGEWEWEAK